MKKRYKIFKGLLTAVLLLLLQTALGQVNISVQVLPPYLYRITDYASHPQQLLITLVNTSATQQRVQLRGAVTGDNGIEIRVKPTFKTRQPLLLAPGQAMVLSGNDFGSFLDLDNLIYTGITQAEAIKGNGLPEGNYRLCVRAYNWDTNAALSADEPIGCSNSFGVTSLEPPRIIAPYDGQSVVSNGPQIISLSWGTPPGAAPSIMYRIRMVEVVGNRNPNDAIMSATQPYFFEKEVMGNMYVYNPSDPQLTLGRRYALMVQAFDPNNSVNFRNKGQSVVTSFTYNGPSATTGVYAGQITTVTPTNTAGATVTVQGSVAWAFDANEAIAELGTTQLVSTKAVNEVSQAITASGKADKVQYPLQNATVYLYATYVNTLTLFGSATCGQDGKYKITTKNLSPAMLPRITNPYIEIRSASGFFNPVKRNIKIRLTNGNYTITFEAPDVLTAASMRISANVVRPSLTNADEEL